MQIVIRALDMQFGIDDAAQSHANRGQLRRKHLRVADHRGVSLETRRPARDISLNVLATSLLFAFDQKFHVHRQPALGLEQPFNGLHEDVRLSFIVG